MRNAAADQVGLPKGTLLSNAMLLEIARAAPTTLEEMLSVPGMRRWKTEVVGDRLLDVLKAG